MQSPGIKRHSSSTSPRYIALPQSIAFLFSKFRLVGLSALLFLVTIALTWLGYKLSLNFVDRFTEHFFVTPPDAATILGWIKQKGWILLKWLYLLITRVVSFYLAFLLAYTLTTPGYSLLSTATEKLKAGDRFEMDDGFSLSGILIDLLEGLKIAGFGIVVSIAAIIVNFIPVIGQILAFLLYTYYSALMFLDYPASRRRWSLGRKIGWLRKYSTHSFRLGLLPALVSIIPIVNIFMIALLFPILTVHATLNFTNLELSTGEMVKGDDHGR